MLDKDLGQEVLFSNVAELFQGLLDGHVLYNSNSDARIEIIDSQLWLNGYVADANNKTTIWEHMNGYGYRLYVKKKWYEDIPKDGLLCWISDVPLLNGPRDVAIIVKYTPGNEYPFEDTTEVCWRYARPFSEGDSKKYIAVK